MATPDSLLISSPVGSSPVFSSPVVSSPITTSVSLSDVSHPVWSRDESTADVQEPSVCEYDSWMDPGFELATSTPCSKSSDECKLGEDGHGELDETTPAQQMDSGTTSKIVDTSSATAHMHGNGNQQKRSLMEELLESDLKKKKPDDKKQSTSFCSKLSNVEFRHAKQKGIKIYDEKEIKTKTEIEKMRRQFWNEKAELLCTRSDTANLGKTEMYGIIDVSWCLRKTSLLVDEARKLEMDEKDLFGDNENATLERGSGKQKSKTITNNVS